MRSSAEQPSTSRENSGDTLAPETGPGLQRWGARPASSYLPNIAVKGDLAVWPTFASARSIATAGSLSLAALFAVAGVTQAQSVPNFAYSLKGDSLSASVT